MVLSLRGDGLDVGEEGLIIPEEIILNILEDATTERFLACKRVRSVRLLSYILLNRTGG